jgi:uncharacterized protein YggE
MKIMTVKSSIVACMAVLLSLSTWAAEPEMPTLSVRGEAQLQVPPDQASIILGVVSESKTAKAALADNNKAMQSVMAALLKQGLKQKEISTQRFGVQPVWSSRPRSVDSSWRAEIVAYRVDNSLQATTQTLEWVPDIIAAATAAGANTVNSISFSLANPRDFQDQAITQAVNNARADADVAAKAAGTRIKAIKNLNLDQSMASVEHVEKVSMMRSAMADSVSAPPISTGNITVRASVSILYELAE